MAPNPKVSLAGPHTPRKAFDVIPPGKAPAPPTSRPGVFGLHKQAQQAQTTVSGVGTALPFVQPTTVASPPPDSSTPPANPQPEEIAATPPAAAKSSPAAAPLAAQLQDLPVRAAPPPDLIAPADTDTPPAAPVSAEPPAAHAPAPYPASAPILSEMQVVVSHHRTRARFMHNKWALVAVLGLLLIVAAADVLLDTGLLKAHFPHTHFFSAS